MIKIGTALFEACEQLERERGISKEVLISSLCDALVAAYKKHMHIKEATNIESILDEQSGEIGVFRTKLVVQEVEDENEQISLKDAKEIDEDVDLDDEVKIEVTPDQFGRIAAQSAKQVITQRIREAERNLVLAEFMDKKGTLTTGIIQRVENRNVIVNIGKTDAIMPQKEQIPGEFYKSGNRIRVFVLNVKETNRLPQVIVSHAHSEIVRELFELEVPEIEDGIVEIKSISREAGFRTKIAVWSNDPEVDSVGACIGPRGSRIQTIVGELKNEKIDIVRYSEDPVEYIVNALSPARIVSVDILADDEYSREAVVVVPDDQLSLAIGREGQNVRLAHKLTGWKIDIKNVSQMAKAEAENQQHYETVNAKNIKEEIEKAPELTVTADENKPVEKIEKIEKPKKTKKEVATKTATTKKTSAKTKKVDEKPKKAPVKSEKPKKAAAKAEKPKKEKAKPKSEKPKAKGKK
ncbi:MAG: transcription termination factor NusA [Candidatus Gastranaerophilales bacterium]|nr:transcription termination factor NusA [Candidatus Gastranaerophilales bacterium]